MKPWTKTGKASIEIAYGITSRKVEEISAKKILYKVRGHWSLEAYHYIILKKSVEPTATALCTES
ncbi:hypothetical protein [sulfur-oxidizing endosymbiont of Gigantopelta aegis]|uniref:hypothetical protein n=1 Tax=sulfur-oxidizing endosymbiont of Gigantopelta aegis TaxID=2794934 RepID=UPI0018DBAF94|nr:hypothetical protein [sulfur-oxidizing endosymbiont of Gigantopelta aegis]